MRSLLSFVSLVFSFVAVTSAFVHGDRGLVARHHIHGLLTARAPGPSRPRKSCLNKIKGASNSVAKNSTTSAATPKKTPTTNNNYSGGNSGVLQKSGPCGESRAQQRPSALSGPNGHIDWLNCGVDGGGWNPPNIKVWELKTQPLGSALQKPDSPFKNCAPFIRLFEQYGNEFGIPPILLASFAMQESSCRPDTVGGAGEQGLMQITHEKCVGAPGGNCREPWFNIRTAARYFSQTLNNNGGNVLRSIGQYNGWPLGMTIGSATKSRWSCCRCQNNLDYLHQFVNGWLQNTNSYGNPRLGKYFNLDVCG